LPAEKQDQVFDLVESVAAGRLAPAPASMPWSEGGFSAFSLSRAMRDPDDDPVVYTKDDLRERWH